MSLSNRLTPLFVGCLLATSSTVWAAQKPNHPGAAYSLQSANGVQPRLHQFVSWDKTPAKAKRAFATFQAEFGAWRASWDSVTGVPSRMFGPGIVAPGSIDYPAVAEGFARSVLSRHIALLAPGAKLADFKLVSNHLGNKMRSVGFYQYHNGVRVIGGQLSFRFKNDRLFVIASEALPNVSARAGRSVSDVDARAAATTWILKDAGGEATARTSVDGPFILPIVATNKVAGFHNVVKVVVDAQKPLGRWDVFVDAITGKVMARQQTLLFAGGSINFNVPIRRPTAERADYAASNASFLVDGVGITTDADGNLVWADETPLSLTLRARGNYAFVQNQAGLDVSEERSVNPGESVTWDFSDDENRDAQLAAFIHTNLIKEYVRTLAPELLSFIDDRMDVYVNINDSCNAYFDGDSINFFISSNDCANTALLADVVYHEFGHAFHSAALIPGVGGWDGAMGEGQADYLAATFVNDPGMGRGFFHSNAALRHLDPLGSENKWPDDIGEIHHTGKIFGGAMWDLRKALIASLGEGPGIAHTDRLYLAAIQRSSGIPSSYVEVMAADDDNGDITDGTPNDCDINRVFNAHGLRTVPMELVSNLGLEPVNTDGYTVSMRITGLRASCGDTLSSATVDWRIRGQADSGGTLVATENAGLYDAVIPSQADGTVVQYKMNIELGDGSVSVLPNNPSDKWYEFFVGEVVPLYCTDFEEDPFAAGWTHQVTSGTRDDWEWGVPMGKNGDPSAAFSGNNVIGNNLGSGEDGIYIVNGRAEIVSPEIDIADYSDVRLQYRRWLNVEDGFFDTGTIYVNGVEAWQNADSNQGNDSNVHHLDSEWRFHDVPLSEHISGTKKIRIKFEIATDRGLHMGGWNIDDFCVVAYAGSICGDGEVTGAEECDDGAGNSDTNPDACRSDCRFASCGDGVLDAGEECDDGNDDDSDECTRTCEPPASADDGGGGCCSASDGPSQGGTLLLSLLVGALLFRRRRFATASRS